MPYFESRDNVRLHYVEFRDAAKPVCPEPLVLAHGFTIDHRMWLADAYALADRFHLILPDSRGHGRSASPTTGYSRDHRVRDVVDLLDHLNIARIHMTGMSMGGSTAVGLALQHPERLASLTLVSTSVAGFDVGPRVRVIDRMAVERGVETAKQRWIESSLRWYGDDRVEIRSLVRTMMQEHGGAIWTDPMRGNYPKSNDIEQVHRIDLSVLILVGSLDQVFVPLAQDLNRLIPGSRLSVYGGVGHLLNLEAPQRFRQDLADFVTSVTTQTFPDRH